METPEFLAAEKARLLNINLDTSKDDYFDQVVAMSQGMINYAIKKIHEQNPDMNIFDGSNKYGSISADLDPCQIIIPVGDELSQDVSTVTWRINFKTGTLVIKPDDTENGKVKPRTFPVDGWAVDVRVPLTFATYIDQPDDTPEKKDLNRQNREWIAANFEVPGDYRPERLFAKMSAARWNELTFAGTSFKMDGKTETWEVWSKKLENLSAAETIGYLFKRIWLERELQGWTSIGTRFALDGDKAKPVERPASYPPLTMIHQSFPYKLGPESGVQGWANGVRTLLEPGSRNCLLYCENINKRKMNTKIVPHSGNFTTIGNPKIPHSRVEGTFVLSHHLFFETFLLPHLQAFVLESQIYPKRVTFENEWTGNLKSDVSYLVGHNPEKDPNEDYKNPIYKFQYIDATQGKEAYYRAHVDVTQENPELFYSPNRGKGQWSTFYGEGSPTVHVRFEKGKNRVVIDGCTNYQSHGTTSDHQNKDPNSHTLYPALTWWHEEYVMTWKMYIDIVPANGTLEMKLSHDSDFVNVTTKLDHKGWQWTDPKTPEKIKEQIGKNMRDQIKHLKEVLQKGFDGQYKFIYPGNGQLDFSEAMFTVHGDLMSEIRYKDLPSEKIVLPQIVRLPPPPLTGYEENKGGSSNEAPKARLEWKAITPVKAKLPPKITASVSATVTNVTNPEVDPRAEFIIIGENPSTATKPVYLSDIVAEFQANTSVSSGQIFAAIKFIKGREGTKDEVEISGAVVPGPSLDVTIKTKPLSSRSAVGTVTFKAVASTKKEDGAGGGDTSGGDTSPIVVPPGGHVTLSFKTVSGKAGAGGTVDITEHWCDEKGFTPTGQDSFQSDVFISLE